MIYLYRDFLEFRELLDYQVQEDMVEYLERKESKENLRSLDPEKKVKRENLVC